MAHYYLYLLDVEGHIKAREILTSTTDAEAVGRTEKYLRQHASVPAVELWLGQRRVTTLQQSEAIPGKN
jgi:hypothetical protein